MTGACVAKGATERVEAGRVPSRYGVLRLYRSGELLEPDEPDSGREGVSLVAGRLVWPNEGGEIGRLVLSSYRRRPDDVPTVYLDGRWIAIELL